MDPHITDVEDLEKFGVLIFISNDKDEMGQRMKFLADNGIFGKSRYEHSLDLWEPEEDVSLYLFHQPIYDVSSFLASPQHIEDMYKKVARSPRTYFVLYFNVREWQDYQIRLLKFDFFNTAKTKMIY